MTAWERLSLNATRAIHGKESRLGRFRRHLDRFLRESGPLPRRVKVTGTAGKGSVCAMLEAMLRHDGLRVCTFTSPHLQHVTERIRLDGHPLSPDRLESLATECQGFFRSLDATDPPSLFETLLFLALHLCRQERIDVAILEVAVGGRSDVVGQIPGPLSAITSIGWDHWEELGPSLEAIARDKAGIASDHSTLVLGPLPPGSPRTVITEDCAARGVTVVPAPRDRVEFLHSEPSGACIRWEGLPLTLPVSGAFQADNFAVAAGLFLKLQEWGWARDRASITGATATRWPGRMEWVPGSPPVLLDAAHNEFAFAALARHLREVHPGARIHLVFGASEPAKLLRGLEILGPGTQAIGVAGGFYRSAVVSALELSAIPEAVRPKIQWFSEPRQALETLRSASPRCDLLVVSGSIYLMGECRAALSLS